MKSFVLVAGLALAIAYCPGARAGILDSPIPQLNAQKTSSLFTASGVVSAGSSPFLFGHS